MKIQNFLPRSYDEGHIISLELKRRLSDRSFHHRQNIRPAKINAALSKLIEVNHFYKNVKLCPSWAHLSESSDKELWDMLTDQHDICVYSSGSESDDEMIDKETEKYSKSKKLFPTVLHNINGPLVTSEQIISIAPGEGQIPVSSYTEKKLGTISICEAIFSREIWIRF